MTVQNEQSEEILKIKNKLNAASLLALLAMSTNFANSETVKTYDDLKKEIDNAPTGSETATTIEFDSDTTIIETTKNESLDITTGKNISIDGKGGTLNNTLQGKPTPAFNLTNSDSTLTLQNITLQNFADSAINNSGTLNILEGTSFTSNGDTNEHGGAISNSGILTISGGTFSGNHAALHGGAIYNSGTLYINGLNENTNILFTDNTAHENDANDIYLTSGSTFTISGQGTVTFNGGIANEGELNPENSSITQSGMTVKLGSGSRNSDYTGSYTLSGGTLEVQDGATFFGGQSTVEGGELKWNTTNDLTKGSLNVTGGKLTVGDTNKANLTIAGGSSVDNAGTIDIGEQGTLTLGAKTHTFGNSTSITGSGNLKADAATITFNNTSVDSNINFSSLNSSTVNVNNYADANTILGVLTGSNASNSNLSLNILGSTASTAMTVDGRSIAALNLTDTTYNSGTLNITGGQATIGGTFGGNGNISMSDGSLNWNTSNAAGSNYTGTLNVSGGNLSVGKDTSTTGNLTIAGDSSIDGAKNITVNANSTLTLGAKNTQNAQNTHTFSATSISGSGNLGIDGTTVTFNNATVDNGLNIGTYNNSAVNVENYQNADILLGKLVNGDNVNLKNLNVKNSAASTAITVDGTKLKALDFTGNNTYTGTLNNQATTTISGTFSGTSGSITNSNILNIDGDASGYKGSFTQSAGTTTVGENARFFGGNSTINSGSLIWNSVYDLVSGASLSFNGGSLTVADGANLTLSGLSDNVNLNIAGALSFDSVTTEISNAITGNGTLEVSNGSLTFTRAANIANLDKFETSNSSVILNDTTNTDSILGKITTSDNANQSNLNLTVKDSTVSTSNITVDGSKIKTLTFDSTNGKTTTYNAQLNNQGTTTISGTFAGTSGSISNSNILNVSGDASGYTSSFTQEGGSTTVTGKFFGGNSSINAGELKWNTNQGLANGASLSVTGADLTLSNNGELTINNANNIDSANKVTINSGSTLTLGKKTDGAAHTFNGATAARAVSGTSFDGSGNLGINDTTVTFNNVTVGNGLNIGTYNNSTVNVENYQNADTLLGKLVGGSNKSMAQLNVKGSTASTAMTVDGSSIAALNLNNATYNGALTINGGEATIDGTIAGANTGSITNKGGKLTWNADNSGDGYKGSLNLNSGSLVVGNDGNLTIKDSSAIAKTVDLTVNGTLGLKNATTISSNVKGSGNINVVDTTLTLEDGASFSGKLGFTNATAKLSGMNSADALLTSIMNGTNQGLSVILDSSKALSATTDMTVDGYDLVSFGFKGDSIYDGKLTITTNSEHSTSGSVTIEDTLTSTQGATGGSIKNQGGSLEFKTNADASGYTNNYTQESGTTTVGTGATFFGGQSAINGGSLTWNTNNDLVSGASLTVSNADLTVGQNAKLTIANGSNIDNAKVVDIDGTLNLGAKTGGAAHNFTNAEGKQITGSGTLNVDGTTATFDNVTVDTTQGLKFTSDNATVNVKNYNGANNSADSLINIINNSTHNSGLILGIEKSNTTSNIRVTETGIKNLSFKDAVTYGGNLSVEGGSVTIDNGSVFSSGTAGSISVSGGTLTVNGNASGYTQGFTQTGGETTVASGANFFGGLSNINGGTLNWNANDNSYAGTLKINNGNLVVDNTGNLTIKGSSSIASTVNLTINGILALDSVQTTIANAINGTGSGTLNISGGSLTLTDNASLDKLASFTTSGADVTVDNATNANALLSKIVSGSNTNLDLVIKNSEASQNISVNGNDIATLGLNGATYNGELTITTTNDKKGSVTIDNTLTGNSGSIKNQGGNLTINANADASGYNGTFSQNSGETTVNQNSKFFGGVSSVDGGTLTWNTNDKTYAGTLNVGAGASLVIGNNGYLEIKNSSTIASQANITINGGTLSLQTSGGTTISDTINGNGTLDVTNSSLTLNSNANLGSLTFTTNNSDVIIDGATDTDALLSKITANTNAGHSGLDLTIKNTTASKAITVDGSKMSTLTIGDDSATTTYSGSITNRGTTTINGNTTYNGSLSNEGSATITGNFSSDENSSGSIVNNNNGSLTVSGNASGYKNSFTQNNGTTNVSSGANFFGGTSTIAGGVLNWNTSSDYEGQLKVNGGTLVIGDNSNTGSLIIKGESAILEAASITINNGSKLSLQSGSTTISKAIGGTNGTLDVQSADLILKNGATFAGNFTSDAANVSLVSIADNDALLNTILTGTNKNLTLTLDGTNSSQALTVNAEGTSNNGIKALNLANTVALNSSLTINGGTVDNKGTLTLNGAVSGETGTFTNSGNITVSADASGYNGVFTQTGGKTTVSKLGKVFGGAKNINSGELDITSDNGVYYNNVKLGTDAKLTHTEQKASVASIAENDNFTISKDKVSFEGTGAEASFTGTGTSDGSAIYTLLTGITSSDASNKIIFNNAIVRFASDPSSPATANTVSFKDSITYSFKDSLLDLSNKGDGKITNYEFDHFKASNSTLDINVAFAIEGEKTAGGNRYIKTDSLTLGTDSEGNLQLGKLYISSDGLDLENGQLKYETKDDILRGDGANKITLALAQAYEILGATTKFTYKSGLSENEKSIYLEIKNAIADTLKDINVQKGYRQFYMDDEEKAYTISKSIGATGEGTLLVYGKSGEAANRILDGAEQYSFFNIADSTDVDLEISDLTIQNASTTDNGSVVSNESDEANIVIKNSIIKENNAGGKGGAIYNNGGNVTVTNTSFSKNIATEDGGAIYNNGTLTIGDTESSSDTTSFSENKGANGGAIFNGADGSLTLNHSISFTSNQSSYDGGAIYNEGDATIIGSFSGNSARYGGAIANAAGSASSPQGKLTVNSGTKFTSNTATEKGGAIYNETTAEVNASTFDKNSATSGDGGAIYNNDGAELKLSGDNSFTSNTATGKGGAIYNAGDIEINTANSVTFSGNTAGGLSNDIYMASTGSLSITGAGTININGGIAGEAGASISQSSGIVNLGGTNSSYLGSYELSNSSSVLNVLKDSSFFGGTSTIKNGSVNWNTKTDIVDNAALVFEKGNLTLGNTTDAGNLTIKGKSSVDNADKITINSGSTLTLGTKNGSSGTADATVAHTFGDNQTISGSGKLALDNTTVTFKNGVTVANTLDFGSVSSIVNIDHVTNSADNIVEIITKEGVVNDKLTLNIIGSNVTKDITVTESAINKLVFSDTVNYGGNLSISGGLAEIADESTFSGSATGKKISISGGSLNVAGDASGYTNNFEQTNGTTTVTNKFFSGQSKINNGTLNWNTQTDITSTEYANAILTVSGGNLNVGDGTNNGKLTINGGNSIDGANTITVNNGSSLTLGAKTENAAHTFAGASQKFAGSGSLTFDSANVVFKNGVSFDEDNSLVFTTTSSDITLDTATNADNLLAKITKGTNTALTLAIKNSTATEDITVNGNNIESLTFDGTDVYDGKLTITTSGDKKGKVTIAGIFSSSESSQGSITNNGGDLTVSGDASKYLNDFTQSNGKTTVESRAKFFGKKSVISGGSLAWNTANDLESDATLTISAADLIVGDTENNALLTIGKGSSVQGANSITINQLGKLSLQTDTAWNKVISGSGTLDVQNSTLTLNSNASLDENLNFTSSNNAKTKLVGIADADSVLSVITKGTNDGLELTLDGSNTTKTDTNIEINGSEIAKLILENNVTLASTLTVDGGEVLNTGDLILNGDVSGNGKTFTNNKNITVNADASEYTGVYEQTKTVEGVNPKTTVEKTGKVFGGVKNINDGDLIITSEEGIYYKDVKLGSGATLQHTSVAKEDSDAGLGGVITSSVVSFMDSATGAEASFKGTGTGTIFDLNSTIDNGFANTVSFETATVKLGAENGDYTGKTTYSFKDTTIDLANSSESASGYHFSIFGADDVTLDLKVAFAKDRDETDLSKNRYLITDSIIVDKVAEDSNGNVKLGKLYISGVEYENGQLNVKTKSKEDIIRGEGASVIKLDKGSVEFVGANTKFTYKTELEGQGSIALTVTGITDADSLYRINDMTEGESDNRQFYIDSTNKNPNTYYISKSLGQTRAGDLKVFGDAADKSILSGLIEEYNEDSKTWTVTSNKGSLFDIYENTDINLEISKLTIENAERTDRKGAVIANSSTNAKINVVDSVIKNNTGSAIYNNGSNAVTINNTSFEGNTAEQGSAIYNEANSSVLLTGTKVAFTNEKATGENGAAVYNAGTLNIDAATLTFDGEKTQGLALYQAGENAVTNIGVEAKNATDDGGESVDAKTVNATFNSGIAGAGTINLVGASTLALNADNSKYTGAFNSKASTVTVGKDAKFFEGTSTFTDDSTLNWYTNNDLTSGTLIVNGSHLIVGNNADAAQLTIKGNSTIQDAADTVINQNAKLTLRRDMVLTQNITGSGTLELIGAKLSFDGTEYKNYNLGADLIFRSAPDDSGKRAEIGVQNGDSDYVDRIIDVVALDPDYDNNNLIITLENTVAKSDMAIGNGKITGLKFLTKNDYYGTITNNGGTIENDGVLNIYSEDASHAGSILNTTGEFTNTGTINFNGTVFTNGGTFTNAVVAATDESAAVTGTFNFFGTSFTNSGTFDNQGIATVTTLFDNSGAMSNSGTFTFKANTTGEDGAAAADATMTNTGSITNSGSFTLDETAVLTNSNPTESSTKAKITNTADGTFTANGTVANNAEIENAGSFTFANEVTGNGKITNTGTMTVTGNADGFSGEFLQTAGSTTVTATGSVFGGVKNIDGGILDITSVNSDGINYTNVKLNGGTLTHKQNTSVGGTISDSVASFIGSNSAASFTGTGSTNFTLNSDIANNSQGSGNSLTISGANITLDGNRTEDTINFNSNADNNNLDYTFDNSRLILTAEDSETAGGIFTTYDFSKSKVTTTGTNTVDLDIGFVLGSETGEPANTYLDSDRLIFGEGSNATFKVGKLYITGSKDAETGYTVTTKDGQDILTNATFSPQGKNEVEKAIYLWTSTYSYDVNVLPTTLSLEVTGATNHDSLEKANVLGDENRLFSIGSEYHNYDSLTYTQDGTLTVYGEKNEKGERTRDSILSGILGTYEYEDESTLTGGHWVLDETKKGSFFNIQEDTSVDLTLQDLTIKDAVGEYGGSIVRNDSATSKVYVENTNIFGNTSTDLAGGAFYNNGGSGETITDDGKIDLGGFGLAIVNSDLQGNTSFNNNTFGKGGAVYNDEEGHLYLQDVNVLTDDIATVALEGDAVTREGNNDIYNAGKALANGTNNFETRVTNAATGTFEFAGNNTFVDYITEGETTFSGSNIISNLLSNDGSSTITGGLQLLAGSKITNSNSDASITNEGKLILSAATDDKAGADASGFTGAFTQTAGTTTVGSGSKFFQGTSVVTDGILNWLTNDVIGAEGTSSTLTVSGGTLNIGGIDAETSKEYTGSLTLGANSSINNSALEQAKNNTSVNISKSSVLTLEGADVTLINNADQGISTNWQGSVLLNKGSLTVDGLTSNGYFNAIGGELTLANGYLFLEGNEAGDASQITKDVKATINENTHLVLNKNSEVVLNADDTWHGNVQVQGGKLQITNKAMPDEHGTLTALSGIVDIEKGGKFTLGEGSKILAEVQTEIHENAVIDIVKGGWLQIGDADPAKDNDIWDGEIKLNGGQLDYYKQQNGLLTANTGILNLMENSIFTIEEDMQSTVANEVIVNIKENATVDIKSGEFNLDSEDSWEGLVKVAAGSKFNTKGVDNTKGKGGQLQQSGGTSTFDKAEGDEGKGSDIFISGNSFITGGDVNIFNGSSLKFGSGLQEEINMDTLSMTADSTFGIMNGELNNVHASKVNIKDRANFTVDLDPRHWEGDHFEFDNILKTGGSTNDTVINVSEFSFQGGAPIDRNIYYQLFEGNIADGILFDATDDLKKTPIGWYGLKSMQEFDLETGSYINSGLYSAYLHHYNPQVFRGQVATIASYTNQLLVSDMVTNHFILHGQRLVDDAKNANKYAAGGVLFAPYQKTFEEGGLWSKSYAVIDKLDMTHNLSVKNYAYGTLAGADLPAIHLNEDWTLVPTGYVGYNGAHQHFDGVSMQQNGGQLGVMGTFIKNEDFITSVAAYGGGYVNDMSVEGFSDETANWYAGTAVKTAYNFHPFKDFIFQPNLFASYNAFGQQNWGTDFGIMSMKSNMMHGVNVAPGANFILSKDTWSLYGTISYMYFINDKVDGKAGNVHLPNIRMQHGYMQYGLGGTKTWNDRLSVYGQMNFMNAGITGLGFQFGLNYLFDINDFVAEKKLKKAEKIKTKAEAEAKAEAEVSVAPKQSQQNQKTKQTTYIKKLFKKSESNDVTTDAANKKDAGIKKVGFKKSGTKKSDVKSTAETK